MTKTHWADESGHALCGLRCSLTAGISYSTTRYGVTCPACKVALMNGAIDRVVDESKAEDGNAQDLLGIGGVAAEVLGDLLTGSDSASDDSPSGGDDWSGGGGDFSGGGASGDW